MANLNDVVTNKIPALIDGLETTEAAIQTACEAVKTATEAIQAAVEAMPLGTFARPYGEITRPANGNAYHAGDVIADNAASATTHAIDGSARVNGGTGLLLGAVIKTDNRAWTQAITVAIYDGAGPTAFEADHAAFPGVLYADMAKCVAVLNFPALAKDADVVGACARAAAFCDFPRSFKCATGSKKLYWKAWQTGTPTPASQQKFTLIPHILQA